MLPEVEISQCLDLGIIFAGLYVSRGDVNFACENSQCENLCGCNGHGAISTIIDAELIKESCTTLGLPNIL